jgi:ElaB/YqjD/DUF883 family membrane-anchored ribosome-binding protein
MNFACIMNPVAASVLQWHHNPVLPGDSKAPRQKWLHVMRQGARLHAYATDMDEELTLLLLWWVAVAKLKRTPRMLEVLFIHSSHKAIRLQNHGHLLKNVAAFLTARHKRDIIRHQRVLGRLHILALSAHNQLDQTQNKMTCRAREVVNAHHSIVQRKPWQ